MHFALHLGIEPSNQRLTAVCHHLGASGKQNAPSFPSFTYFIYAKFGTHHNKAALNHLAPLRATLQALGVSGPRTPKCAGLPVSWANRQLNQEKGLA
jgi:hypothetical protein